MTVENEQRLVEELRVAVDERDQARERAAALESLAGDAVTATVPLLPLTGSWTKGYAVEETIHTELLAQPEEWASAAQAVSELHAALIPEEAPDA